MIINYCIIVHQRKVFTAHQQGKFIWIKKLIVNVIFIVIMDIEKSFNQASTGI